MITQGMIKLQYGTSEQKMNGGHIHHFGFSKVNHRQNYNKDSPTRQQDLNPFLFPFQTPDLKAPLRDVALVIKKENEIHPLKIIHNTRGPLEVSSHSMMKIS